MRVLALAECKGALFAASSYDGVFRSTDNGATWNGVNTGLANTSVFSLVAHDSTLFAGTYGNGVFLSTNNGKTWSEFNTGFSDMHVYSLIINNGILYAGTEGHGLWSRPLSETSIISDQPNGRGVSTMLRYDIRTPNPANPLMSVAFSLSYAEQVSITVYSVSGALVATVVNKYLNVGSYNVEWDSHTAARGCYIVRIQEGNNSLSKVIRLVN